MARVTPLQNRVLPDGTIMATPARGTMMGNRGILHDGTRQLGPARWRHRAWVCCLLDFRGRHRAVMTPRRYNELFFLDEAVALAAGHRPCAQCRYQAYRAYCAALQHDGPAAALDRRLHDERALPRQAQLKQHRVAADDLPDGAFVLSGDDYALVLGDHLVRYSVQGYQGLIPRVGGQITCLTPPTSLIALAGGYRVGLHPSAFSSSSSHSNSASDSFS